MPVKPLSVRLVFAGILFYSASLSAQVNPVNDFFGGFSVVTIGGDARDDTWRTPIGWQASVSQRIKKADEHTKGESPISIVGDFGGQFKTLDNGNALHVYEFMGGVRLRAGRIRTVPGVGRRIDRTSAFVHALFGGTTRSVGTASDTGFMMGYGGGVDVMQKPQGEAYAFGVRAQFDWLPSRVNDQWANKQFRLGIGIVLMARYWD
jgi:hypothetical protein